MTTEDLHTRAEELIALLERDGGPEFEEVADITRDLIAASTAHQAEIARLQQQIPQWQPIETAPKGERVLIGGGGCPRVHENELRCFKSAGCCWSGLGDKQQPTHWMPLPLTPPQTPEPPTP